MNGEENTFDVTIIGAGPAGYVSAIRASQLGLKTAIVEREYWGGVCLNVGCVPTKALLKNAEIAELLQNRGKEFGFSFDNLSLDFSAAHKRSRQISGRLVKGVLSLMRANDITSFEGSAEIINPQKIRVTLNDGGDSDISTRNIIIATGARPRSIPGVEIDGEKVITYLEAILSPTLPKSAIIIGGGPIGIEFAYIWRSFGVDVTIVEMLDRLLPLEDPESSSVLARNYKKMGIKALTGARVEGVEKSTSGVKVMARQGDHVETLAADQALVAVSFTPNTENIGLDRIGVCLSERGGFIEIGNRMQTNIPGIYAIGDVTGKLMLAHVGSAMGIAAAEAIAGQPSQVLDYDMMPRCVYAHPQIASFGYTEDKAGELGYNLQVGKFFFLANGKALGLGEKDGFIKIISDTATGELLGAHLVGPDVTELLPELTLARSQELTAAEIGHNIHAHPTLSEALMEAAHAVEGKSIHGI
ncbi:MAG: dihydrolipoyl dehydrogenase [Anaerolineales bacterium]|nr:dihydrolipoyl dehydrogenase [Anaerolineales bacterium]